MTNTILNDIVFFYFVVTSPFYVESFTEFITSHHRNNMAKKRKNKGTNHAKSSSAKKSSTIFLCSGKNCSYQTDGTSSPRSQRLQICRHILHAKIGTSQRKKTGHQDLSIAQCYQCGDYYHLCRSKSKSYSQHIASCTKKRGDQLCSTINPLMNDLRSEVHLKTISNKLLPKRSSFPRKLSNHDLNQSSSDDDNIPAFAAQEILQRDLRTICGLDDILETNSHSLIPQKVSNQNFSSSASLASSSVKASGGNIDVFLKKLVTSRFLERNNSQRRKRRKKVTLRDTKDISDLSRTSDNNPVDLGEQSIFHEERSRSSHDDSSSSSRSRSFSPSSRHSSDANDEVNENIGHNVDYGSNNNTPEVVPCVKQASIRPKHGGTQNIIEETPEDDQSDDGETSIEVDNNFLDEFEGNETAARFPQENNFHHDPNGNENGNEPCRIPSHVCGGEGNDSSPCDLIRQYMTDIKKHWATMSIEKKYLPYVRLLNILQKPGISESACDSVFSELTSYWRLDIHEDSPNEFKKPPTRDTMKKWLTKIVHPEKHWERAKPSRVHIQLRDGRHVMLTKFDLMYSLAMLFCDETLFHPDNFIFPNKHDPHELPDYDNIDLGDINTGLFHQETMKILQSCSDDEKKLFLFPILAFIDATMVKRNSVEPFTIVPGIFNSATRNLSRSWIVLGYVEPLSNIVGDVTDDNVPGRQGNVAHNKKKLTQKQKLSAYHDMLGAIQEDLMSLQKTGFYLDIPIPKLNAPTQNVARSKRLMTKTVLAVPVLQAILSDTKGANGFTARYGSHGEKVQGLCRDCDISTRMAANVDHRCTFFTKEGMSNLTELEKKNLSFHSIENAFDKVWMGYCEHFGVYGATPPELLHVFYLGICEYLYEGFMDTLSTQMILELDAISKEAVRESKQFPRSKFPDISCFRKGIRYSQLMITGKEKMGRIFLIYLCLQKSSFVHKLSRSKKRATTNNDMYEYSMEKVKRWYKLMEWTLAFDRWLRCESHPRRYFFVGNGDINFPNNEPIAQTRVRTYMRLFKSTVKRKKGTGLLLTKFHHLLHFVHYTRIHGKMSNFDGSRPEAHGKDMTKNPGLRTNHQLPKLTYSIGTKHYEDRTFRLFVTFLFNRNRDLCDEFGLRDYWSPEEKAMIEKKRETFVRDEAEDFRPKPSGSRFEMRFDRESFGNFGSMKIKWTSRTRYNRLWSDHLLHCLEQTLYDTESNSIDPQNLDRVYSGFTELKIYDEINKDVIFLRAHPMYKREQSWFSWALVKWEDDDSQFYPAKVYMFLDNIEHLGISGNLALIQSAESDVPVVSRNGRIQGELNRRYKMEMKFRLITTDALAGIIPVIEDETFEDENHPEMVKSISVLLTDKMHLRLFYGEEED